MHMVQIRKITNWKIEDGTLIIESDPVKTRYYISLKKSWKVFEAWSTRFENEQDKTHTTHRQTVTTKEMVSLLFSKVKMINSKWRGTMTAFDNGVPFINSNRYE